MRKALFAVQRGICPGCGIYLPHYMRFEVDHNVAFSDEGETEERKPAAVMGGTFFARDQVALQCVDSKETRRQSLQVSLFTPKYRV